MEYIEFKLHAGRIPYFVKKFINRKINNRYYGIGLEDKTNYLPENVIKLTKEQLEEILISNVLYKTIGKPGENIKIEMTDDEKLSLINEL